MLDWPDLFVNPPAEAPSQEVIAAVEDIMAQLAERDGGVAFCPRLLGTPGSVSLKNLEPGWLQEPGWLLPTPASLGLSPPSLRWHEPPMLVGSADGVGGWLNCCRKLPTP